MSTTTDASDPELGHGVDDKETGQHKKYLVLSEEEIAKGFVRPYRTHYVHVGNREEVCGKPFSDANTHVCTMKPGHEGGCFKGRSKELLEYTEDKYYNGNKGCGTMTGMAQSIAETYAAKPDFYGSTYCLGCKKHLAVDEFVWHGTEEKVGS